MIGCTATILTQPAARRLPVADPLKDARSVLTDILCDPGLRHQEYCRAGKIAGCHRTYPPAHPVWKEQPPCNCWVGRVAAWLSVLSSSHDPDQIVGFLDRMVDERNGRWL